MLLLVFYVLPGVKNSSSLLRKLGAFNGVSRLQPRLNPTEQRSDFFEACLLEMFCGGGSRFLVRARTVNDNLRIAGVTLYGVIDVCWMRRNGARNYAVLHANMLWPHIENDKLLAIVD